MRRPGPGALTSQARIAACAQAGRTGFTTLITECWGQPPLLPRITTHGVHFVGGAAGPLGGDRLESKVDIGAHARLRISSVAATFVRPAAKPAPSLSSVVARIGSAGRLWWMPQPMVVLAGAQHRSEVAIEVAATGELFWLETAVLGRHGEPGGLLVSRRSLDIAGQAVSRQELRLGVTANGMSGPAVTGGARAVASFLVVHPEWERISTSSLTWSLSSSSAGGAPSASESPRAGGRAAPRAGILPLASKRAVEILGLGQSVHEIHRAWELLASQIEAEAPCTSRALRSCATTPLG